MHLVQFEYQNGRDLTTVATTAAATIATTASPSQIDQALELVKDKTCQLYRYNCDRSKKDYLTYYINEEISSSTTGLWVLTGFLIAVVVLFLVPAQMFFIYRDYVAKRTNIRDRSSKEMKPIAKAPFGNQTSQSPILNVASNQNPGDSYSPLSDAFGVNIDQQGSTNSPPASPPPHFQSPINSFSVQLNNNNKPKKQIGKNFVAANKR